MMITSPIQEDRFIANPRYSKLIGHTTSINLHESFINVKLNKPLDVDITKLKAIPRMMGTKITDDNKIKYDVTKVIFIDSFIDIK
jgi:hypothetical protein